MTTYDEPQNVAQFQVVVDVDTPAAVTAAMVKATITSLLSVPGWSFAVWPAERRDA